LVSVAFDIALNPVFIFGVGPIPRFGIAGSALATLVSQAISFTAMMVYLYRQRHPLVLHKDEWHLLRLDWPVIGTLIKKGIPMSAQMLVLSLSGIVMISIVNRYGVETAAAYGATIQLWNYIQMPAFAVGMAVSSMAAQNVGARKWDRVASIARVGVVYATLLTAFMAGLIEILNTAAYSLYLQDGSVAMAAAVQINRIATPSFIFFGVTLVLFGVVRATGAVMAPLLALTIALLGVRIPLAEILTEHFGVVGIWWAFPLSSAFGTLLAVGYYKLGGWRSAQMESAPVQSAEGA
jgi:putative MATE family efflux protein